MKSKKKYKLYRGLCWDDLILKESLFRFHNNIDYSKIHVGSIIKLDMTELTSWTTDQKIAGYFTHGCDNAIIIETTTIPDNVLVDIPNSESEIILKPGKYNCKIIDIIKYDKTNRKKRLDVKNMSFGLDKQGNIDW